MKLVDPNEQIILSLGTDEFRNGQNDTDQVVITNSRLYHFDKNSPKEKGAHNCIDISKIDMISFISFKKIRIKSAIGTFFLIAMILLIIGMAISLPILIIRGEDPISFIIQFVLFFICLPFYLYVSHDVVGTIRIEYSNGRNFTINLKVKNDTVFYQIRDAIYSVQDYYKQQNII